MKLEVVRTSNLKAKPQDETKLGFGRLFTDYMFTMQFEQGKGWYDAKIRPFENFSLSPACSVLHYSQTIFEGLKAYHTEAGMNLFRPWDNFRRMNISAKRMCMPEVDEEFVLQSLDELLKIEKDWVPKTPGTSLYIRPTMMAVDPFLGVSAGKNYLFYIILSPVGAYYESGLEPVDIYVEDEYVRAVDGGTGFAKAGGNYAASLLAGEIAHKKGFAQVLWLDGKEKKYVQEVGSMNIFFKIRGELVTAPLAGSILPGITRDSVITLSRDVFGTPVREENIAIADVFEQNASGGLEEVFGTGTAAVISPVGGMTWKDKDIVVADGSMGELTRKLYNTLTGMQYGVVKDDFGWIKTL
ncbi:MAG: branched-chain amino acid aminotransferase [Clostridia bacterium]|jgi:branched-chain amino acid aminotransferase|nr:branched-chain amino acid aminotransferase [Clostridia bacterium]